MTFTDLYHLNDRCRKAKKDIDTGDMHLNLDEQGRIVLYLYPEDYDNLNSVVKDCKRLIYELCLTEIKDVIKHDT